MKPKPTIIITYSNKSKEVEVLISKIDGVVSFKGNVLIVQTEITDTLLKNREQDKNKIWDTLYTEIK
jgi:hypothetical protein